MLMPIHTCDVDSSQVEKLKGRSKGVPFDRKNEQSLPVKGSKPGNAIVHGARSRHGGHRIHNINAERRRNSWSFPSLCKVTRRSASGKPSFVNAAFLHGKPPRCEVLLWPPGMAGTVALRLRESLLKCHKTGRIIGRHVRGKATGSAATAVHQKFLWELAIICVSYDFLKGNAPSTGCGLTELAPTLLSWSLHGRVPRR
jgi:hypothetical protein